MGTKKKSKQSDGLLGDDTNDLLKRFTHWLIYHQGVTESTKRGYVFSVSKFMAFSGPDPATYSVEMVRAYFFSEKMSRYARETVRSIGSAVRAFLRFLVSHDLCASGLAAAVPRIANWQLSTMPRYLPEEQVERIILSCDLTSMAGARDQAALLLLARLGLRARDVAGLRFEDIDWKLGKLLVVGKGHRETRLPLPQEVGDSILHYIENFRPAVQDDHILLRVQPPYKGLQSKSVSLLVGRAIKRTGIDAPSFGAHLLRHSFATKMLRQGTSLEYIGAILRHRSVNSTAHYAKVDLPLLQSVVQPWPAKDLSC